MANVRMQQHGFAPKCGRMLITPISCPQVFGIPATAISSKVCALAVNQQVVEQTCVVQGQHIEFMGHRGTPHGK